MSQSLPNSIITSTGYINNLNILMLFCDPNNSDITSLLNCHGVFIKGSSVGNIVYARYTNAMENMAMINGLAHMVGVLKDIGVECGSVGTVYLLYALLLIVFSRSSNVCYIIEHCIAGTATSVCNHHTCMHTSVITEMLKLLKTKTKLLTDFKPDCKYFTSENNAISLLKTTQPII